MAKFRKKPVVIEAIRWNGSGSDYVEIKEMDGANGGGSIDIRDGALYIETLEGSMRADVGDWIIRGVKGELYPCKPDIFAATYELVQP